MYGSEIWTWHRTQNSRVRAVEMSYLRRACSVTRWQVESNESVNEGCGMGTCENRVKCGVVGWVKINHLERKKSEEFVKKVHLSETDNLRRRGRPVVVKWEDRIKDYMHEMVVGEVDGIEQARRDCMVRERWIDAQKQ